MQTLKILRGIELRYVLTIALANEGTMSVAELSLELKRQGFGVEGRPSKTISDALRWEVVRGRVIRPEHGCYAPGYIPRSAEYRIRRRIAQLKYRPAAPDDETANLSDDEWWANLPDY